MESFHSTMNIPLRRPARCGTLRPMRWFASFDAKKKLRRPEARALER